MVYINGKPIKQYGAEALAEWSVSGTPRSNTYLLGRGRTTLRLLDTEYGLKTITLPVVFDGLGRTDITIRKSMMDAAAGGAVELQMPDGLTYTAILQDAGSLEWDADWLARCTYTFDAVQHGTLVTSTGNRIYCTSTMPRTDCCLQVSASTIGDYQLGDAKFSGVGVGDTLTFDGINGRILINGGPGAHRCEWIDFPGLVPGWNSITAADPVTIQYYPCYI